jgi:NAD(P)H-hydrate epimerase
VLTAEEMREVDRRAIEEVGLPGLVLMENAAIGVVDALAEEFPEAERVFVVCGPGNNGGDGLAVARLLDARGYRVEVLLASPKPLRGDAETQRAVAQQLGLTIFEAREEQDLAAPLARGRDADLVVDALFGTGLSRPLAGFWRAVVEGVGKLPAPRLAVDLPSGLDGSRPRIPGPHLTAQLTVTFAAPKVAHVLPPASAAVGKAVVASLGFSPALVEGAPGDLHLLTEEEVAAYLDVRPREAHKGTFGHLLVVAGSAGKSGAALLATRAAVRAGAGLVTAAVPEPIAAIVDAGSVESMTLALPASAGGGFSTEAAAGLRQGAEGKDAVALGPGLGAEEESRQVARRLALELTLPLVLDADGLNAFAGRAEELRRRKAATILTPHAGELARLLGSSAEAVAEDRLAAVRQAALATGCVVILKGYRSLVAAPEGGVWINPTGGPGMATGGSGDVLTGILGALLAQGFDALAAAQLGVYLHGLAGDLLAEQRGERSLAAGDLVRGLGAAWQRLESS